jgi:type I restriction enzyme, S subunit
MYWPDTQTDLKPLKSVTRLNPESLSETTNPDFRFDYIDIGSVVYGKGITTKQLVTFSDAPSRARKLVRENDLIISTVRTYLRAIARIGREDDRNIASTGFAVCRPVSGVDPAFLFYAVHSQPFIEEVVARSTGISYPAINPSTLGDIKLPVPSERDQVAIARFLDRETGLIDGLIEKKTRFIALLKEKRAAVIAHAVTKGIDPDAPMKDSGVDWLGRVPAHWEVVPPTALFTESKERAREGDQMLSATQKYGVIPLAEYEALEQRQVTMAVVNLNMRKHVEVGDFVISMRSMDGGLERARAVGSVRSSYSVLKPGPDVEGRFYGALMKSSLYIQALRLTSNFIRDGQDLNFGHVRKVKLPKPDLREQAAIADHIEAETARIDGLISLTERSIDLLREKRAALITAAVTGKIDVRAAA